MRMMMNQGAPAPKDQAEAMTKYLIKTAHSCPHGVMEDKDGDKRSGTLRPTRGHHDKPRHQGGVCFFALRRYLTIWSFGLPPGAGGVGATSTSAVDAGSGWKNRPWLFSFAKIPCTAAIGIEHSRE